VMRWYVQDEVNQDYSEQNEVDGMKKGADSTGKVMHMWKSGRTKMNDLDLCLEVFKVMSTIASHSLLNISKMAHGESNGHVTDDVTHWPERSSRDSNTLAQYLENSWRCYQNTNRYSAVMQ